MKITDAMVDRVVQTLSAFKHPGGARAVRNALEAALSEVPDGDETLQRMVHEGIVICKNHAARIAELEERVAELEEQLESERIKGMWEK